MPELSVQGRSLYWREQGEGPAVVLVHGFCEDSRMYDSFLRFLADAGYRVLAPDLPGFGRSETQPGATMTDYAEVLEHLIRDQDLERPVIIGHSMGGYAALEVAHRQEVALSGLGLFHSHAYPDNPETKKLRAKSATFISKHGLDLYLRDFFPRLFTESYVAERPYVLEQLKNRARQYDPEGVITAQHAMAGRKDHRELLRQTNLPVLFLLGLEDNLQPREAWLAQTHLPQTASIHLLPGIAHMGAFEAPDKCVRIVREYLDYCRTFTPLDV